MTQHSGENELKPCPFCLQIVRVVDGTVDHATIHHKECVLGGHLIITPSIWNSAEIWKLLAEKDVVLNAWHSVFGTTQLTHAQVRLESAEKKVTTLQWRVAELERCVSFFASVIKSGEPWTAECEASKRLALNQVTDPRSVSESIELAEQIDADIEKLNDTEVSQPNPSDTFGGGGISRKESKLTHGKPYVSEGNAEPVISKITTPDLAHGDCKHGDIWFSRMEPMGEYCGKCGKRMDISTDMATNKIVNKTEPEARP